MKTNTILVAVVAIIIIAVVGFYAVGYGSAPKYSSPSYTTVQASSPYGTVGSPGSTTANSTTTAKTNSTSQAKDTVTLETSSTLGTYLANASGFTLYTYSSDVQNSGKSNCNGGCASAWPPFYTASLVLPSGLSASSFTTIMRNDGTKQLAYNGWPLYLFGGDGAAGQTNGQNVSGFVVATK
ncbi:MAG: hypothetical protein KGH98_02235 [Candidatus Micrarchaeota archaeon]|nr:hypothetical protein [Candidatus Micrarchaeota archaeon]